jgi:hypothetical protein
VPALIVGLVAGLACLRLALIARSRGGRVILALGLAVAAVGPLVAYLAQETAERESSLEAAHAEPSLLAAIATQAPLIILAFVAVRLLVTVVSTVVWALRRRIAQPMPRRAASEQTPAPAALLPARFALRSSNGQRAPPCVRALHQLAPSG